MIGFVVEGPSDEMVIREVAMKLGETGALTRVTGGHNPRRAVALGKILLERGCRKVLLLEDTHCQNPAQATEDFKTALRQNGLNMETAGQTRICIIASTVESWLLADEQAISDYLGGHVDPVHNPEAIHEPDKELDDIFKRNRAYNRGYFKGGTDPKEIAKRLSVEKVREKCAFFREFEDAVRDP